jgi:GT2 family glycosyltransferase
VALSAASVTAVVPTIGRSPLLADCVAALRHEGGGALRILVVEQGGAPVELPAALGAERLRAPDELGFARAANLGIAAASTPWVALVNDDVVPRAPWLGPLVEALERDEEAASAQGVNFERAGDATAAAPRVDGCGLAWNRRWQAVQLLHRRPAQDAPTTDREVFGVSATAALYRRAALAEVAAPDGGVFDARLGSYYEDVDLACRLRAAGYRALLAAGAACEHLGSTSMSAGDRTALVYRNRYLVLARLLGRSFWPRLPWLVARDLATLLAAEAKGDRAQAGAIARGLGAATVRVAGFASLKPPLLSPKEARRASSLLGAPA